MVADIRVHEEVGRVTACPERSRMGARHRANANKPSPWQRSFGVPRSIGARPTNASSGDVKPASLPAVPAESSTDCRPAAFALSEEYEMIIAPWPRRKER